ncbi:MAG: TonB-dependent siderophore receptor [Leptolyngbyaceae cyanobacterium CSU_1_4]|nr:TonB-dependent siderophore receptor [Leptolyngbyaceae cyanobacterium CSU_1_4]
MTSQRSVSSFGLAGIILCGLVQPVWAGLADPLEIESYSAAIQVAQMAQIVDVQINVTPNGLDLRMETEANNLQPTQTQDGKRLIIDIPNAQLRSGTVQRNNPVPGIAVLEITQLNDRVRVIAAGTTAAPTAAWAAASPGLQLSLIPAAETAESLEPPIESPPVPPPLSNAIRLIVTGDRETYRVAESSVGTRTDTDILDVPQAIQVIPEQVLEDQDSQSLGDSIRNSAGISTGRVSSDSSATQLVIRGFSSDNILRNGLRDATQRFSSGLGNVDRVEILRGPASVLYGFGDLGGTVNIVTKQPLDQPTYSLEYTLGQFNTHNASLDFSAPFGVDNPLGYRLNASYSSANSFRDFEENEGWFVSPAVRLIATDDTTLTADLEYFKLASNGSAPELPAIGTVIDNPNGTVARSANLGAPSLVEGEVTVTRLGYQFEHRFSPDWRVRNELLVSVVEFSENTFVLPIELETDQRTLRRGLGTNPTSISSYTLNTNGIGTFNTGSLEHQLLAGVELSYERLRDEIEVVLIDSIDIFDYRLSEISPLVALQEDNNTTTNAIAFYLQDQITISDNLILVLGGRFDSVRQNYEDFRDSDFSFDRTQSAFSPRAGLVFKPEDNLSLYASYSQSFKPLALRSTSRNLTTNERIVGDPYDPERGRQFEVGFKADLWDDRLSTTLALYHLTRTNVDVTSGSDTLVRDQVGEQRSQGVELTVSGELSLGWNIIGSYAYTDAVITNDDRFEVGNRLANVPRHAASLWTTYEIQEGALEGLGFGIGLFYQGEREGDLDNSFILPSYLRTDASLFYRRDRLRVALNFKNLFNTSYYEGARSDVRVIPGAPFSLTGTVSWEF